MTTNIKTPPAPPTMPPPVAASNGAETVPAAKAKKPGRLQRRQLGERIVSLGVEGIGKTSLVAYAPNPLIVMCGNETGYEKLMNNNRVPEVDALHVTEWDELLASLNEIHADGTKYGVIAIDALGGAERMCHEKVCNAQFNGVWGEKGFQGFQRGFDVSVTEWLRLLGVLDKFHEAGTHVVLLSHIQVRPFKNPMGDDYDQYKADVHHKTWAATHRWADHVFFMQFKSIIEEVNANRHKGKGKTDRMLYTERRDAFDAKNRAGMPEVIALPDDPSQMWHTLDYYMKGGQPQ